MLDQDNNFYLIIHLSVSKLQSPLSATPGRSSMSGGGWGRRGEEREKREERCEELEFCRLGWGLNQKSPVLPTKYKLHRFKYLNMKVFKVNGSEEKDQQGLGFKAWSMCRKPQSLRGST